MHHLHEFNFAAIVVCAVLIWIIGAAWYSPLLFARQWVAIVGRKMGEKPKGVYRGMIGSLLGDILLCFVVAHILRWAHADDWRDGLHIGILLWIAFVVAPLYPQSVYEGRPFRYFAINSGYWLVSLLAASAILASWH
jgi:hypothetical protein